MNKKTLILQIVLLLFCFTIFSQRKLGVVPTNSGGILSGAQASYDISFYQIDLKIEPDAKSIDGSVLIKAKINNPLENLVLDLDSAFNVNRITLESQNEEIDLTYEHKEIKLFIKPNNTWQAGEYKSVRIYYRGQPKIAPKPPWVGGFTWKKTASGHDWIATSVQFDGADLWIPCKDHPSDEADSVELNITVPDPLLVISNGKRKGIKKNSDQTSTHSWKINSPINNYNIALNIAPYDSITTSYTNINKQEMPITWWVLPESKNKAKELIFEFKKHIRFYEEILGPYPYRKEKYGIAETPHLGMEHSTVIAFGDAYQPNKFGWNFLHHHELGHEWWGNLVTAADWKDFWIHEGFCIYMQALYNEKLFGEEKYHEYFVDVRPKVRNKQTLAPKTAKSTKEKYFFAPEYVETDGDIYTKGALVLHTLRYLIGKDALYSSLRKFCYPDKKSEQITDGSQFHFVSSDDFIKLAEEQSGKNLKWFFELYLRQPIAPNLIVNHQNDTLYLEWDVPKNMSFPMPVEIKQGKKITKVEMPNGKAKIYIKKTKGLEIDPKNWIYKKSEWKDKRELRAKLDQIEGLKYKEIKAADHFTQSYHLIYEQPLDHFDKEQGKFEQHIYLSHSGFESPTLLETCGYEAYNYTKEIAKMTQGNQLIVEYRYFGNSKPKNYDWKYLRNKQSVEDYHRITTNFKNIYSGKWISSGISKGGQNCISYRSHYPNDVDVTIPYVAPIALAREDERTNQHINSIGEKWCRDKVFEFQKLILNKRDELIPLLKTYANKLNDTYSIGYNVALEYAAYEYTFSFWQWSGNCEKIPDSDATIQEIFDHVNQTVGWAFYSDKTIDRLYPSYYQHMVELGYYGFQKERIINLVKEVKKPDNLFFTPDVENIPVYNNNFMKKVWEYATNEGNNFIYIYGEYDTWSACAINPDPSLNSLKMVKKRGNHATRIKDFNKKEKRLIYDTLQKWLEIKINPL